MSMFAAILENIQLLSVFIYNEFQGYHPWRISENSINLKTFEGQRDIRPINRSGLIRHREISYYQQQRCEISNDRNEFMMMLPPF